MKTFLLLAVVGIGIGMTGCVKAPRWTPEMCGIRQPAPVSEAYVRYCMKVSPDIYGHNIVDSSTDSGDDEGGGGVS